MAFTGGIKFFDQNFALLTAGGSVTASSGAVVEDNMIDKNPLSYWISVGSDDLTTESIVFTFPSKTINRIFLQDHNFKGFNVQYWNGSAFTHFTGVSTVDGAMSNITETAFAQNTAYYEFNAVTTTQVRIQVTTTQTVNAQKFLSQMIVTSELGTLSGFPDVKNLKHSRNERKKEMLSGKFLVVKGIDSFELSLDFKNYPSSLSSDIDLMMSLFDREFPFLIWLCGGRYGSQYFRYTVRGFRLQDIYLMGIVSDYPVDYYKNLYVGPVNLSVAMKEHV